MRGMSFPVVTAAVLCLGAGPTHTWRVVGVTDGDSITCLTSDKQQVKIRYSNRAGFLALSSTAPRTQIKQPRIDDPAFGQYDP
jgi:hypothetical protein